MFCARGFDRLDEAGVVDPVGHGLDVVREQRCAPVNELLGGEKGRVTLIC